MTRVLITGSRDWKDRIMADKLVRRLKAKYGLKLAIVIGDCPTGIDNVVTRMARRYAIKVEKFKADWDRFGLSAGPRRNAEMVATKPDFCIACHQALMWSKGTRGCVELCLAAGIKVYHIQSRDDKGRRILDIRDREILYYAPKVKQHA